MFSPVRRAVELYLEAHKQIGILTLKLSHSQILTQYIGLEFLK